MGNGDVANEGGDEFSCPGCVVPKREHRCRPESTTAGFSPTQGAGAGGFYSVSISARGPLNITFSGLFNSAGGSLWGEEFRPERAPFSRKRDEVARLLVLAFRTIGGFHPRLRAPQKDMRARRQPAGVVERAGTDVDGVGSHLARAIDTRGTVAAEPRRHLGARRRAMVPALRFALRDTKALCSDRHVEREGAAGRSLAVRAVAGVEQQRERRDLVADRAAGAAAGHRQRWLGCAHLTSSR